MDRHFEGEQLLLQQGSLQKNLWGGGLDLETKETKLLLGSLSNDLHRVVALFLRGSEKGSQRFLIEAKRWASLLVHADVPPYIREIITEVMNVNTLDEAKTERLMMYGALIENHTLTIS